jgi:hypothetical protein
LEPSLRQKLKYYWANTWPAIPEGEARGKLKQVIRYQPVSVDHAWRFSNTKRMTIRTVSYGFDLSNGLSASGVWLQAVGATDDAPLAIVLNDKGYASAGEVIAEHVNRRKQVLALDPVFVGSAYPESPNPADWPLLIASSGERPLGLEAAQLAGVAKWLRDNNADRPMQLETDGIRTSMIATVAAAVAGQPPFSRSWRSRGAVAGSYRRSNPRLEDYVSCGDSTSQRTASRHPRARRNTVPLGRPASRCRSDCLPQSKDPDCWLPSTPR